MPKSVLILQNVAHEEPGMLSALLQEFNIPFDTVHLENGEQIPSITAYGALIVMGGPDSANDETEKMHKERDIVKEALDRGLPYLGICLGLQVLVKVAGGSVVKSSLRECGFRDPDDERWIINITDEGRNDPLFEGIGERLPVFHFHGETVELTPTMVLLGKGTRVPNQIVRVGSNAYGIQCHFELTHAMFEKWIRIEPWFRELETEDLRNDFTSTQEQYRKTGRTLFTNFLRVAKLIPA